MSLVQEMADLGSCAQETGLVSWIICLQQWDDRLVLTCSCSYSYSCPGGGLLSWSGSSAEGFFPVLIVLLAQAS
jgi:hypothetical protein